MSDFGFDAQSFIDLYSAKCKTCLDDGYIEVDDCNCAARALPGVAHEPKCGVVPCPEGCLAPEEVPW